MRYAAIIGALVIVWALSSGCTSAVPNFGAAWTETTINADGQVVGRRSFVPEAPKDFDPSRYNVTIKDGVVSFWVKATNHTAKRTLAMGTFYCALSTYNTLEITFEGTVEAPDKGQEVREVLFGTGNVPVKGISPDTKILKVHPVIIPEGAGCATKYAAGNWPPTPFHVTAKVVD